MNNMFEDRVRAKAADAEKTRAAEKELQAQRGRVAVQVSEQLIAYIDKYPDPYRPTFAVRVEADRVTVRKKASPEKMEITTLSPTTFQLSFNGAFTEETDRNGMIDAVLEWMSRSAS